MNVCPLVPSFQVKYIGEKHSFFLALQEHWHAWVRHLYTTFNCQRWGISCKQQRRGFPLMVTFVAAVSIEREIYCGPVGGLILPTKASLHSLPGPDAIQYVCRRVDYLFCNIGWRNKSASSLQWRGYGKGNKQIYGTVRVLMSTVWWALYQCEIGIISLFCPYRVQRLQDPVKPPDPDRPHYTCQVWWWVCRDDTHSPHILLHHSYRWETLLTASHSLTQKGLTITHHHHHHSYELTTHSPFTPHYSYRWKNGSQPLTRIHSLHVVSFYSQRGDALQKLVSLPLLTTVHMVTYSSPPNLHIV